MQASIRHTARRSPARRSLGFKRLLVWGATWALIYVAVCSAASASATFVRGAPSSRQSASAQRVDNLAPQAAPVISATKADTFAPGGDVNGNGKFDPGDTIQYTVIISNTGSADATGVAFNDTIDVNTALVGGSITASPVTVDDAYAATGNVSISVPVGSGVLANDYVGLNPVATITASDPASTQGGSVTVNADGSFTYNPPANFTGTDVFHYTLSNSSGSSIGTVTIHVSDRVLFVSSGGVSNCKPATPCSISFADGLAAPASGKDLVFVESGTYSTAAFSLNATQVMAGQAISIGQALTDAAITLAPNSQTLSFPASTTPVLNNSATIVTLSSNNLAEDLSLNPSGGSGVVGNAITTGTTTVRNITVGATGSANGVNLTSNAGGTFNFSNIGITAASGAAFNATGGGTVNVTGANNVLATTTGTALNIANTTIGASGMTFKSISANGATNGIVVNNAGTGGFFTVTGTGTTAGSGGTIQNITNRGVSYISTDNLSLSNMNFTTVGTTNGADPTISTSGCGDLAPGTGNNLSCNAGIHLQTVTGVTLTNVIMNGGSQVGINGNGVTNFVLTNSSVQHFGDQVREDGLKFTNMLGTSSITNTTFGGNTAATNNAAVQIHIENNTGAVGTSITLDNVNVQSRGFAASGVTWSHGLQFSTHTTGNARLVVKNSTFNNLFSNSIDAGSDSTGVMEVTIGNDIFTNVGASGINIVQQNNGAAGTVRFNIHDNGTALAPTFLRGSNTGSSHSINIDQADDAGHTTGGVLEGAITNNHIGDNSSSTSANSGGDGIRALTISPGTLTILISGNTVLNPGTNGIDVQMSEDTNAAHRMNATILGNTAKVSDINSFDGIRVEAGAVSVPADAGILCLEEANNTGNAANGGGNDFDVLQRFATTMQLRGYTGGSTNTAQVQSYLFAPPDGTGNNTAPNHIFFILANSSPGGGIVNTPGPGNQCAQPTLPFLTMLERNNPNGNNAIIASANAFDFPLDFASLFHQTAWVRPNDAVVPAANLIGTGSADVSTAAPLPSAPSVCGTVCITVGTLNPGKSVTIKFQVTINNPWTGGNTTTVSNQGTVSGSNFANVLTDDPKTPAPNDPTVTQIFLPADMVVAKSHAGSFRQGDVGDTYLITVTNTGIGPTVGTVFVTDTIPSGLVATGFSGTGWTCSTFVTCNRSDVLFIGSSYPALALTVTVANNAPALVTNTVTVGGGGEITLTNDIATDPTTIIQVADLTITKTHSANFTQGDVGDTYLITVTNSGPGPTAGAPVTVTDSLPAGLSFVSLSGSGWTCNVTVCTRSDNLINGSNYPVLILTVNVDANAAPVVTNTVTVAGGGELNLANDTANDPTIINQKPDLTVAKTHKDPFRQGDVGDVYTITVSNIGLAATSSTVYVTDTLPSGLVASGIGGSGWSCVVLTLTCNRSDVLGASSNYAVILLTVTVGINAPAVVTNTVTVGGGGELITSNDTANDVTNISQAPDLSIAKTHNDPFKQGDVADVYTITVSNVGFAPTAGTVTVTDTLPSGLSATAIGGTGWVCTLATLTCTNGGALLAGNSYPVITLTVSVGLNTAPVVTNTATVTGGAEINPSNNTANDVTNVQGADLVVAKTHKDPFKQGDVGDVYTVTVSNTGTSTTTATVYVTDTLPGALTPTAIGGTGWTCVLVTLSCQRSDALGPGGSYPVITLTVNVASNAPVLVTNTVTVAGGGEANLNNDTANDPTNILALVDLQVSKTGPATVVAGANLTYTLVVTNAGPGDAQNAVLTDTLPAGVAFVSQQQLSGPAFSLSHLGNAITDTLSTLTAGATASFQVVVQANANVPNGTVLNNRSGVTSGSAEQNPADNTSSASTTVQTQADLQLSKSAAATVSAGAQLTYTLVVTNAGPSDAQSVVLTDTLPAATVFVSQGQSSGPSFTLSSTGNALTDTISTLAAGATASFQVVVNVPAGVATGTLLTNSAGIASSTADPAPGNNTATTVTTVQTQADLRVTKSGPAGLVTAGTDITYTVSVTNAGPSDAQTVVLSDTLDDDTSFVSQQQTSGPLFAMSVNGNTITGTLGTLATGAGATFRIVAHVSPGAASGVVVISPYNITNTVSITSTTSDPAPNNNTAILVTPLQALADLAVSKSGPATMAAGTNLTYTVILTNNGPSDSQNVVLSDTLPAGTVFVSQQQTSGPAFTAGNSGNLITDTIGALSPGATASFQFVAHVNSNVAAGTLLTNSAAITSTTTDPTPSNNTSTTVTSVQVQVDLQVSKTGPATVVAGTQMTYTIVVTNAGPGDAQNVVLTDTLPAGASFVSQQQLSGPAFNLAQSSSAITDTMSTLAAGTSATFQVVVQVAANVPNGTVLTNTATVTSGSAEQKPADNTSSANTTVQAQADLQVSKSAAATVVAGTTLTYTIVVTNAGPSDAQNVVVTDTLPAGTSFVSQQQTNGPVFTQSQSGSIITDTIGTLAAGASASFQVVVLANASDANGSVLVNSAGVTGSTADLVPANNASSASTSVQTQVDLQLSKNAAATVLAGAQLTYTLVVTNAGPSDAQSVMLTDTLPAGTSFVSQQQTSGPLFTLANAGNAITDTIATLPAGASATFQVVVLVASNQADASVLTNNATVSSITGDPAPKNNSAATDTTVQTAADLQVSKSASSPVLASGNIIYTLVVTNAGPSDAQNVVLTDTLPVSTTFVSQQQTSGPSFTLSNVGNALSDTLATLPAGSVARFVVTATVSINVPDLTVITNTASITSGTADPLAANNTASVASTVRAGADLSVVKSGPASVVAGTNLTYTLVVSNGGPLGASATLTDVLPLNVTFQSLSTVSTAAGSPTCQAPAVGQNGTLVCQQTLAAGDVTTYTLVTNVPANVPAGTLLINTATVRSPTTPDVVPGNNTSTVQTQVTATADLQIVKRANKGTAFAGDLVTYTIVVTNIGPSFAANVVLTDVLPLSETFRSLSTPGGWSCTTPAVGANGTVTCSNASLGLGAVTFVLVVKVNYGNGLINTHIVNQVTVTSDAFDPTMPDVSSADVLINGATVLKLYLPIILRQVLPGFSQ